MSINHIQLICHQGIQFDADDFVEPFASRGKVGFLQQEQVMFLEFFDNTHSSWFVNILE